MKKTNFIILFALSLYVVLLCADKVKMQNSLADVSPTLSTTPVNVQYNRDMWDIIFTFDCQSDSQPGIETDLINIYTSLWNGPDFFRYEMDGTFVESFTIDGVSNIRDMAYDDTYFYGSPASMTIYIMDLANQTLIGTIPVTCGGITGVRHIAYDPGLDGGNGGFWIGNWNELGAITMSGAQIYGNISPAVLSLYGSAYDPWTGDEPYLWMFSQTGGAVLHQFEIATQIFTGVTHDCSDIPGFNAGHAGGAATYLDYSSLCVLLVNIQQDPNIVAAYELTYYPYSYAPGAPTDVLVIPDAGGALVTEISWVCPTLTWQGDPLIELLEMRVYRDDVLIYTDFEPVIGGPGNCTDNTVPISGLYDYKVAGYNSWGEGIPVIETVWVGEDVPNVVEDLLLEQTAPGVLSGTLTWVNPTTGLNGGAFNEPILGYHIVRSDGPTFELAGIATTYVDDTIPSAGVYFYTVQAYNVIGDGGIETSNAVLIFDPGLLIMEDFSSGVFPPAGWYIGGLGQTNWSASVSNNAGGVAPEAEFYWSPSFIGISRLVTMPVNTVGMTFVDLEFKHYLDDHYGGPYTISVETTSDGSTWNPTPFALVNPAGNVGPETQTITITNPDVGSATFQLGFTFSGDSYGLNWWNIDDVILGESMQDPGWIEGMVTLNGGPGPVENVEITADGITVYPDASGSYLLVLDPGTYDITATLDGYEPFEVTGVVIISGQSTPINIVLNFLFPPTNLSYQIDENDVILNWDAPVTDELTGYKVYRDDNEIAQTTETTYTDEDLPAGTYTYFVTAIYSDSYESEASNEVIVEMTHSGNGEIPLFTKLNGNYPNPFNPMTNIQFNIKENETGILSIFNLKGQTIKSHEFNSGIHNYSWNAKDCSSGIYFYKLEAGDFKRVKKMILIK